MCNARGLCQDRLRFEAKVVRTPSCAWWKGALGEDGYGRYAIGAGPAARTVSAHRWLWEHELGRLADNVMLRHCCDETNCVRLDHLRPGTHELNMSDMVARGRQGGPFHRGRADTRGAGGRARAIRAALAEGYDTDRLATAMLAGDPHRHQLVLFN